MTSPPIPPPIRHATRPPIRHATRSGVRPALAALALAAALAACGCSRPAHQRRETSAARTPSGRLAVPVETVDTTTPPPAAAADTAAAPPGAPSQPGDTTAAPAGAPPQPADTAAGGAAQPADTAAPPAAAPPDSGAWATHAVAATRAAAGVATLRQVRFARHEDFDRVVFEFDGALPGYRVAYGSAPAAACGSGRPVAVAGAAHLETTFTGARAHDDAGRSTVDARSAAPGLPNLRAAALTCDFEGHVAWTFGFAGRAPFRVLELRAPPRIVLDVRHP